MTEAYDDDTGRNFAELNAHEVQRALAEELSAPMSETENPGADDERDAEPAAAPEDPVYSAAEQAAQARMAEALLFAAAEPLDETTIAARLPYGADVPAILEALSRHYEGRGVTLSKVAGKWRFATAADVAHVLETERVEQRKLSRAALETLAIIAYHQPCTRADIEDVRGVMVSKGSLDQLLEIGWVRLKGRRRDAPGRPVLYATTPGFLEHFGLESVNDLPGLADLKAAGLLDARLPPGFAVPTPTDAGDGEDIDEDGDDDAGEIDFLQGADAAETPE